MSKYTQEELEREQRGDTGYAVDIEYNCPHAKQYIGQLTFQSLFDAFKNPCGNCTETEENWICLSCGGTFCSRYKKGHMAKHNEQQLHQIAMSLSDLSCWCYQCSSYIENAQTKQLRYYLQGVKFGTITVKEPSSTTEASSSTAKPKTTSTTTTPSTKPKFSTSHKTEEEIQEHFDSPESVAENAKIIAQLLKNSKHTVVYTGAGISTSANIPDYRGPQGVWTLKDKGLQPKGIDIEMAFPTYGHYALRELVLKNLVKYVVSTNVDGLHRRSGIGADKLAELHGNCYKEICSKCNKEYLRGFDVTKKVKNYMNHITGRQCTCGGALKDTIIHFTETLPAKELQLSIEHSEKADLVIVLGTSMRVAPACNLPLMSVKHGGKMIIVNLQLTPYDKKAFKVVHSKTDEFLQLLMKELGMETFDTSFDVLQHDKAS